LGGRATWPLVCMHAVRNHHNLLWTVDPQTKETTFIKPRECMGTKRGKQPITKNTLYE
jgi:hypothetical protein